jgi:hypothetical protein
MKSKQASIPAHALGFRIWRTKRFNVSFSHRVREAFWILTGQWSLHRAWQIGHDQGTQHEWQRVIVNMGDITAQRRNVEKADANLRRPADLVGEVRS